MRIIIIVERIAVVMLSIRASHTTGSEKETKNWTGVIRNRRAIIGVTMNMRRRKIKVPPPIARRSL
jgi:hypothetical protein